MKLDDIKTIAVIGAGAMGHGIAELAALAGYSVRLQDISAELVKKGYDAIGWSLKKFVEKGTITQEKAQQALARITTHVSLPECLKGADFVAEAAPEIMKLKLELFREMDKGAPAQAVLATNTSSLSITELGKATKRSAQVVGMHFFNPPVKMALVEVIRGEQTSEETMTLTYELAKKLGKTPIRVEKDVRGFIVNRVLVGPLLFESAWIVSRGEATVEQVDSRMKFYEGFPMGPFELQDLTGIDIGYHLNKEAGRAIPPIVEERVRQNELGRKTGKGFYNYKNGGANYSRDVGQAFDPLPLYALMANEAAWLIENRVSTADQIDTACQLGAGFPQGILQRADRIGLEKVLHKLEELHAKHKDPRYAPTKLLREMVQSGKTGEASGEGFYRYEKTGKEYKSIKVEIDATANVAWVILNRPQRLNTINADMREELPRAFAELQRDERVRVIVMRGAGERAFCAGADVNEFVGGKPHLFVELGNFPSTMERCSKPVIAAIDGYALGGGLELALACDFRIATERSQLGQPEIKLGLIPGAGGTQRLTRLVGLSRAKELVMLGDFISAARAYEIGLVDRVLPHDKFVEEVRAFAEKLASGPPIAMRLAKQIMNLGADASLEAALLLEREAFGILFSTEDMIEGVNAFLTKKKPDFKGR